MLCLESQKDAKSFFPCVTSLDKYGLACSHDCKGLVGSKGDLSTHSTFVMSTSAEIALCALSIRLSACALIQG